MSLYFVRPIMNNKIPNETKSAVIRLYLQGESRNQIAKTSGLGEGTVSNIIQEWRFSLSNPDADSLRELTVNLNRFRIDAAQCAIGFRAAMIMKKLGINEGDIESFITEVFSYCKQIGITPHQVASNMKPLVELSKSVPLENIPSFVEEKENQVKDLEKEIEALQKQKRDLNIEVSTLKELRDTRLQEEKMTRSGLSSYLNSKEKLAQYGLFLDTDIPKLTQLVINIEELGFNPQGILSEYFDLQSVKAKKQEVEGQISWLESRKSALEYSCAEIKDEESRHSQTLIACNQLKSIGFGFRELKILKYTITEAARALNMSEESAVSTIFQRLEMGLEIADCVPKEKIAFNNLSFNPLLSAFHPAWLGSKFVDQPKKEEQKEQQQQASPSQPVSSISPFGFARGNNPGFTGLGDIKGTDGDDHGHTNSESESILKYDPIEGRYKFRSTKKYEFLKRLSNGDIDNMLRWLPNKFRLTNSS